MVARGGTQLGVGASVQYPPDDLALIDSGPTDLEVRVADEHLNQQPRTRQTVPGQVLSLSALKQSTTVMPKSSDGAETELRTTHHSDLRFCSTT